jgi:hypothetical protein
LDVSSTHVARCSCSHGEKLPKVPEGWARGIPVSCWRLISGPSRGSEHIPTGRPFPMTGATRDHSGRLDPNGKHPYSPRLAVGQLARGGMFVFRGCDSVKRRPTPPRSLSKGKCRKGRTKTVSTSGFFFTGDRGFESFPLQRGVRSEPCQARSLLIDRDRKTPRGATPPTPPGIRVRSRCEPR